jgi:hypothetical protein
VRSIASRQCPTFSISSPAPRSSQLSTPTQGFTSSAKAIATKFQLSLLFSGSEPPHGSVVYDTYFGDSIIQKASESFIQTLQLTSAISEPDLGDWTIQTDSHLTSTFSDAIMTQSPSILVDSTDSPSISALSLTKSPSTSISTPIEISIDFVTDSIRSPDFQASDGTVAGMIAGVIVSVFVVGFGAISLAVIVLRRRKQSQASRDSPSFGDTKLDNTTLDCSTDDCLMPNQTSLSYSGIPFTINTVEGGSFGSTLGVSLV